MPKPISKINWERYKNSSDGMEAIADFNRLRSPEITPEEMVALAKKYDPQFFWNMGLENIDFMVSSVEFLTDVILDSIQELEKNNEEIQANNLFLKCYELWASEDGTPLDEIPEKFFKNTLSLNIIFSSCLYRIVPDVYLPNFFVMQFSYLKEIAEKYELELPEIPNRSNYFGRHLYYLEISNLLYNFINDNGITDPAEACAFIYGYEMPLAKEEVVQKHKRDIPELAANAWILVGNYHGGEKGAESLFWQANQFTEKGDILLFYEKSPVKKLNSVWIALEDGTVDPFFHYYAYTFMGHQQIIPDDKAITFAEFKEDEYFKTRDSKGNFVAKNFQDVSGWSVTNDDYNEIKRMLEAKGYDTSKLPRRYEPKKVNGVEIHLEKDVSDKLLIPLLEQMGWKLNEDFHPEVEFKAGRGTAKRPDFCLHMTKVNGQPQARVIIEVKKFMKNEKEVEENFSQGETYAKWGNAKVLVTCDERKILIYERNAKGNFDPRKFTKFSWEDMDQPDKYQELKRLLS